MKARVIHRTNVIHSTSFDRCYGIFFYFLAIVFIFIGFPKAFSNSEIKSCSVGEINLLYVPMASEQLMKPLLKDVFTQLEHSTGCSFKAKAAIDYNNFIEKAMLESYQLVLAPAHAVTVLEKRLDYKLLVSTKRVFFAGLVSYQPLEENNLSEIMLGKTLYIPDVFSGVYLALDEWLHQRKLRYKVRIASGYFNDDLISEVANEQIEFAVIFDMFANPKNISNSLNYLPLPLPLGPIYILYHASMDSTLVEYLKILFLELRSKTLESFLETETPFVPGYTYPAYLFPDPKRKFEKLLSPGFFKRKIIH